MNSKQKLTLSVVGIIAFIAYNSLFVIDETERAIKLQFGRIVEADILPGLHMRWPLIEKVRKFDARVLTVDAKPESFFTVEGKRLIVDSYAKWKIVDVQAYYKAIGGIESDAVKRLADRINDGLRNQFGTRTLHEVVSGSRDELMQHITRDLNETVKTSLGIVIVDVRVKRIDLPETLSKDVYRRMTAEREKEAKEIRAKGRESAIEIHAQADRQVTVIQANAYREAEEVRGTGDAVAAATYAEAFTKDAEFYSFTRSLKAYRESFSAQDMVLVKPDSDYFRYLKDQHGGKP